MSDVDLGTLVTAQVEALHASDKRLLRTVDALTEEQWREPSLLPGWTRAHVIAHLALNGEGLSGALEGLARGEAVPVYPSDVRRDEDIDALAEEEAAAIRERLFAATKRFRDATEVLTPAHWASDIHRLPDGPRWPAATVPEARRREVEIHHADLDAGYVHGDWPADFTADLLSSASEDRAAGDGQPFAVHAVDLGRTWEAGASEPVVEGSGADLGWWLVGRGAGEGLVSSSGNCRRWALGVERRRSRWRRLLTSSGGR